MQRDKPADTLNKERWAIGLVDARDLGSRLREGPVHSYDNVTGTKEELMVLNGLRVV
jgi:hypothetical protein